jgi:hypothetical protein
LQPDRANSAESALMSLSVCNLPSVHPTGS